MLLDCTWESFYVQDFDSQEGGGGFDPGGGGGGGSWGDGNNNENPPPPPNNPCQHVNNLASSSLFQSKMQYLTNYTGLNFEAGYILRDMGNGIINYEYVQGQDGALEINFACGAGNRIRGIIHTHPDNGLPIFSGTDIRVIYNAYRNLCINGLEFVTIGLVTSTGTYLLVVNDPLAFINFGANYLKAEDDYDIFEFYYLLFMNSNPNNPEKGFLELLNYFNTGLMLFKGNLSDFSQWAARTLNNSGTPVNTKCN